MKTVVIPVNTATLIACIFCAIMMVVMVHIDVATRIKERKKYISYKNYIRTAYRCLQEAILEGEEEWNTITRIFAWMFIYILLGMTVIIFIPIHTILCMIRIIMNLVRKVFQVT